MSEGQEYREGPHYPPVGWEELPLDRLTRLLLATYGDIPTTEPRVFSSGPADVITGHTVNDEEIRASLAELFPGTPILQEEARQHSSLARAALRLHVVEGLAEIDDAVRYSAIDRLIDYAAYATAQTPSSSESIERTGAEIQSLLDILSAIMRARKVGQTPELLAVPLSVTDKQRDAIQYECSRKLEILAHAAVSSFSSPPAA